MGFDPTKRTDIEDMTSGDYSVWRTSKQNEIAAHAGGGSFNLPARTLMTLALNAYVDVAGTLRELSLLDVSDNRHGFTQNRRDELLKQLRGEYENGRKLFTFSIANATHGMTAAAKVIEVGHSSMSSEEKKRFDALAPRKRNYDGGYKGQNYSSYNAIMNGRNEPLFTKEEALKMLLDGNGGRGGGGGKQNPAARSVCWNCQRVGHWSKNCPEPKKAEIKE